MIHEEEVRVVKRFLICDTCSTVMIKTERVLQTKPLKFEYQCPKCGFRLTSEHEYPYIEIPFTH